MFRSVCITGALALNAALIAAAAPPPPRGLRPYLVAVSVANLEASAGWYEDVLGLRVVDKKAFPESGIKIALLEADGFRLELVELRGSVSPSTCTDVSNPAALRGFGKYAFQIDDLAEFVKGLERRGVAILHDARSAPKDGERSVIIKDNDGNWLQFFQRPRSSGE